MKHEIIMPDLGQTAAEGKIIRWLKRPGEKVAQGDPILEVETDKVTMEVESYEGGYLRALLVNEGEMASAMSPIAILTDEPEEAYDGTPLGEWHRRRNLPCLWLRHQLVNRTPPIPKSLPATLHRQSIIPQPLRPPGIAPAS